MTPQQLVRHDRRSPQVTVRDPNTQGLFRDVSWMSWEPLQSVQLSFRRARLGYWTALSETFKSVKKRTDELLPILPCNIASLTRAQEKKNEGKNALSGMQVGEGEEASPLPASTSIDTKKKLMQLIILIQLTLNERYIRSFPFCWTNDASYVAFWQTKKIRVGSRGGGVYAELNAQNY